MHELDWHVVRTVVRMARIDIKEDHLIVTIEGWHKVLALKSKIEVPIACVTGARLRPEVPKFTDGDFRGTYVPGRVTAGMTVRSEHGVVFCDVEDPSRAIAIDLQGCEYKHILVELSDMTPEEGVRRIEAARHATAPANGRAVDAAP